MDARSDYLASMMAHLQRLVRLVPETGLKLSDYYDDQGPLPFAAAGDFANSLLSFVGSADEGRLQAVWGEMEALLMSGSDSGVELVELGILETLANLLAWCSSDERARLIAVLDQSMGMHSRDRLRLFMM